MEEEKDNEVIDYEARNNGIIDDIGYVTKKTGLGVASGVAGIGQSILTESANEMEKGTRMEDTKSKFVTEAFTNSPGVVPNPGTALVKAPGRIKRTFNILRDKNKKFPDKLVEIFLNASTDVINDMPAKQTYDAAMNMIGNMNPEASENVMAVNQLISDPLQKMQNNLNQEAINYGSVTQTMGNVGQVVGNMVPSITAAAVTKNPQISLAAMGISTKGQSTMEALQKGADLNEAVKIGNGKAMVEIGTEMLFGGVNIFGKGALDDIVERGIVDNVKNDIARKMAKKGADITGEVLEETISDIIGTMIDKGTVDPNANYTLSDWKDTAITTVLSTVVLNTLTRGIGGKVDIAKNENSMQNGIENLNNEVTQNNNSAIDKTNIQNENSKMSNFWNKVKSVVQSENSRVNNKNIANLNSKMSNFWDKVKSVVQRGKGKNLALPEPLDYSNIQPRIIKLEERNAKSKNIQIQDGENVKTQKIGRPIDSDYLVKILNSNLTIDNVVELLKVSQEANNPNVTRIINDKLKGNKLVSEASQIMKFDNMSTNMYNNLGIMEVLKIQKEIFSNIKLQEVLNQRRLQHNVAMDPYMAVYIKVIENMNQNKYFENNIQSAKADKTLDITQNPQLTPQQQQAIEQAAKRQREMMGKQQNKQVNQTLDVTQNPQLTPQQQQAIEQVAKRQREMMGKQQNKQVNQTLDVTQNPQLTPQQQQAIEQEARRQQENRQQRMEEERGTKKPQESITEKQRREFRRELVRRAEAKNPGWYTFNSLEGAIQQYISSYIQLSKEGNASPYKALVEIAGKQETGQNGNVAQQSAMINAYKKRRYIVDEQKNTNGDPSFIHIRNKEYANANIPETVRIYLNPTRANTALLANEILKKMGNNPIYLKFTSEQEMSRLSRNEKIVIYTNNQMTRNGVSNLNQVINAINQVKKEHMNLFKGCETINPFLKNVGGIAGIAPNPRTGDYIKADGKIQPVAQSYNSFLAQALNESVEMATNELTNGVETYTNLPIDKKLSSLMQANPAKLAITVKKYLQQCQNRNSILDIRGLRKQNQNERGNAR